MNGPRAQATCSPSTRALTEGCEIREGPAIIKDMGEAPKASCPLHPPFMLDPGNPEGIELWSPP